MNLKGPKEKVIFFSNQRVCPMHLFFLSLRHVFSLFFSPLSGRLVLKRSIVQEMLFSCRWVLSFSSFSKFVSRRNVHHEVTREQNFKLPSKNRSSDGRRIQACGGKQKEKRRKECAIAQDDHCYSPVSYTHLTLPTILRV